MNSHEVFIHIHQGCFAGTGAIVRLSQCQWSKPDGYGKTSQCIITTKHSKAKTMCIFLGIYCMPHQREQGYLGWKQIQLLQTLNLYRFCLKYFFSPKIGLQHWIQSLSTDEFIKKNIYYHHWFGIICSFMIYTEISSPVVCEPNIVTLSSYVMAYWLRNIHKSIIFHFEARWWQFLVSDSD